MPMYFDPVGTGRMKPSLRQGTSQVAYAVTSYKTPVMALAAPGVPVDDFPVGIGSVQGITNQNGLRPLGVMGYNAITSITTSDASNNYTITTDYRSRGKDYTFLISRAKYPYGFCVNAQIGMELTADRNTFIAGTVKSWTMIDTTLIILVVTCPAGYAGVSGYGAPTGTGSIVAGTDWTLGTHTPPGTVPLQSTYRLGMTYPQTMDQANYYDWDMSKLAATYAAAPNPGLPNPNFLQRTWYNASFETANVAFFATTPFLDDVVPYQLLGYEIPWTWDKFAVYATVTSAPADGTSTNLALGIDALPSATLPGQTSPQLVNTQWRVVNISNPRSMSAAIIKSSTSTSINVMGPVTDIDPYWNNVRTKGVKPGDRLAFFPVPCTSMLFGGQFILGRRGRATFTADLFQSAPLSSNGQKLPESVISFLPSGGGHPDFLQCYGGEFGPINHGNIVCHYGWDPAHEAKLPGSWYALFDENPNDYSQVGFVSSQKFPWNIHDQIWITPPNNVDPTTGKPVFTIDKLFKFVQEASRPILGIRTNDAGFARISFDQPGNGYMDNGDTVRFGGSQVAGLNGGVVLDFTQATPKNNPRNNWGSGNAFSINVAAAVTGGAGVRSFTVSLSDGLKIGQGTMLDGLGFITSISTPSGATSTTINVDTDLPNLGQGAYIGVKAWMDTTVPYSSSLTEVVSSPQTTITGSGVQNGAASVTIPVQSTTGFRAGMVITSGGYVWDTTILSIDDATHMTISHGNNFGVPQNGYALKASMCMRAMVMAPISVSNFWIRGYSGNLFYNGAMQAAGLSVWNMFDADTGAPLTFGGYTDANAVFVPASQNVTAINAPLGAPTIASVTKTSATTAKVALAATIPGALGYQVSLDGKATWTTMAADGTIPVTAGTAYQVAVRAMNAANDLGVPVNPGAASGVVAYAA